MRKRKLAKKIELSGLLEASRRVLFTASPESSRNGRFELDYFYQFGSCVAVKENGVVYAITASHVIRNATTNNYINASPFFITPNHPNPENQDFLYPMRYYDCSPGGEHELDIGIIEMTAMIFRLGAIINLDDKSSYIQPNELFDGAAAVVSGYPEETNQYACSTTDDGEYTQTAIIKRELFKGTIKSQLNSVWFENITNRENYTYSGLSGGVIICCTRKKTPKPLGIVISSGENGKKFKVIPFYKIKSKYPSFDNLNWEVIDEAYFLHSPLTHSQMKYEDFAKFASDTIRERFIPQRTNAYLEQLDRSMKSNPKKFPYLIDMHKQVRFRIVRDLVHSLIGLIRLKQF